MTDIAIIDWFGRWGTSVFSENTAIFLFTFARWRFCCGSSLQRMRIRSYCEKSDYKIASHCNIISSKVLSTNQANKNIKSP